jgi:small multidrug resistance protein
MMKTYLILFLAIVFETVATSFLKQSGQFTKLVPSIFTLLGYAAAFYCLSIVLKSIPVGIAYAIWSGVGIVLIALIGFFVFKQHLDLAAIIGLALIIAGVVVINVFSNSVSH